MMIFQKIILYFWILMLSYKIINLYIEWYLHYTLDYYINYEYNIYIYIYIVGSQIVAHTQMETGDGSNKPNTINL